MPIDARTAVAVASRAGLSLPDARALAMLADTEAEAAELAAEFTTDVRLDLLSTQIARAIRGIDR